MRDTEVEIRPEPRGLLIEPPRRPPIAIGAATAPPPSDPYSTSHTLTRRIALGILTVILVVSTLALAWSPSAPRLVLASGTAVATADVALQSVSGRAQPWREIVGPAARRFVRCVRGCQSRANDEQTDGALQRSARAVAGSASHDGATHDGRESFGRSTT